MRALFIGHDHVAQLGVLADQLREHGVAVATFTVVPEDRYDTPWVDVGYPDAAEYDLVISAGAPWPAELIRSWSADEERFLLACHSAGTPVLGICFGAQLLARALGGSVRAAHKPETGWTRVSSDDESTVPSGTYFQWHEDSIHVPRANVIASNDAGIQAFRYGTSLGVQFHPEMTSEVLALWQAQNPSGDDRADARLRAATRIHERAAATRARTLTDHVTGQARACARARSRSRGNPHPVT